MSASANTPLRSWAFGFAGRRGPRAVPGEGVALVEGDAAIRQAILLLLATVPGERVMRPDYGCDLHRLVFSPADDTAAGLAIHYVRRAVERWEPRIELLGVDATALDGPARIELEIVYRVRVTGRTAQLAYALALGAA